MLFPLIESQDPELFDFLKESTVEPFFALPWMITWFSHHLDRFEDVKRLFDVFICSHPLFCLYISASVSISIINKSTHK
jgi:hypothetical protein